jgi:transcriptional antiterminator NusG
MEKKWYILQVHSGFEEKVKTTLEERIRKEGLEEFFGGFLIPTEQVVEMIKGSRKTSSRRFFPGYMLVSMELNTGPILPYENMPGALQMMKSDPCR